MIAQVKNSKDLRKKEVIRDTIQRLAATQKHSLWKDRAFNHIASFLTSNFLVIYLVVFQVQGCLKKEKLLACLVGSRRENLPRLSSASSSPAAGSDLHPVPPLTSLPKLAVLSTIVNISRSVVDPNPYPDWIRIQEGKNGPQN